MLLKVLQLSSDHLHAVIGAGCTLQASKDRLWGSCNSAVGHFHVADISSYHLHGVGILYLIIQ